MRHPPHAPPGWRREKARELQRFATRQLGCNYWAIEYQGHGDSSPNFLECTLATWCERAKASWLAGGPLPVSMWPGGLGRCPQSARWSVAATPPRGTRSSCSPPPPAAALPRLGSSQRHAQPSLPSQPVRPTRTPAPFPALPGWTMCCSCWTAWAASASSWWARPWVPGWRCMLRCGGRTLCRWARAGPLPAWKRVNE